MCVCVCVRACVRSLAMSETDNDAFFTQAAGILATVCLGDELGYI